MSHDPLLDKIREIRSLLTSFQQILTSQKRFTPETAALFSGEDRKFWAFQEEHERLKHSGVSLATRDRWMKILSRKAAQWSRLCTLAESGGELSASDLTIFD